MLQRKIIVSGMQISSEQLVALNEEIAALIQAGVPLELGLRKLGQDSSTVLKRVSEQLVRQLEDGVALDVALTRVLPEMPRAYAAVVQAGIKSGSVPAALQSLSRFTVQGLDLRSRIELSLLYPLLVCVLAYSLLMVVVVEGARSWDYLLGPYPKHRGVFLESLKGIFQSWPTWAWIPPVLLLTVVLAWVFQGRKAFYPQCRSNWVFWVIPGLRTILRSWHWSSFQDLLATLIEHQVPLPQALLLAGDATVDETISQTARELSQVINQGGEVRGEKLPAKTIPTHLRWALLSAPDPQVMTDCLRQGAESSRDQATRKLSLIRTIFPAACIVVFGGGAVLLYAMSVFVPLTELLSELVLEADL